MVSFILPLHGQYLPKDSSKLNYNQIMFEAPYNPKAKSYTFNIIDASGSEQYLIVSKKEQFPITLIKDLEIGKSYKWSVSTELKNNTKENSKTYYFSILNSKLNESKKFKSVQHYNNKTKILDGIIWCDQYRCAIDRNGKIVWFVPDQENDFMKSNAIRDLKMNSDGSLTLINHPNALQCDLNFNIQWQAPTKGFILDSAFNGYHHAFQKLENGNYMILANEKVNFANEGNNSKTENIDFCNIVECDKNGKIVWSWLMKEHFPYELLVNSKVPSENGIINPHANSFTIDAKNNVVYLSFKNLNRIIKIDKLSKKIIASYGTKLDDHDDIFETDIFQLQHDIQFISNNDFLIFNNNDINNGKISSVDIIHFPIDKNDGYQLKYRFYLNYDAYTNGKVDKMGSVKKLTNNNYLICEGSLNRISEISPDKQVIWDFSLQQIDSTGKVNPKFSIYRANYSSGLYPYYFITMISDTKLIIYNKGSEQDNYKIELFLKNNLKQEIITDFVKENKTLKIKLPISILDINKVIITSLKSGKQKEVNVK
jgi:hypothetical protein